MNKTGLLVIPLMFRETAKKHGDKKAIGCKASKSQPFSFISYSELADYISYFSAAMFELGVNKGDKIAIMSENNPEWVIADIGIMNAGAVNVPVYPTLTHEQLEYILNNSGCRGIIVSNNIHYQKAARIFKNVPSLEFIVNIRKVKEIDNREIKTISFEQLINTGKQFFAKNEPEINSRLEQIKEDDMCSIIYTSGTTGEPKGVMLTHKNFLSNAVDISEAVLEKTDIEHFVELSFLPLSHVFERVVYYSLLVVLGSSIAYAEGFEKIHRNLPEIKPNIFVSVPRIYEKIQEKIMLRANNLPPLKRKIFNWALKTGKEYYEANQYSGNIPLILEFEHWLADKLVYSDIRENLGGNMQILISGGAPLSRVQAEFFASIGLPILEGYGLTESSPVLAVNRPGKVKIGTVGQIIPNVEIKIAEDGEILARGPNIMKGYYNDPAATAEVIGPDGWLHTGDIGELDSENYLKITDRKKEIIVMSNGKNVAPQHVENMLTGSSFIEQALLIGDNKKYISALIVPDFSKLTAKAREMGITELDRNALVKNIEIIQFYRELINNITRGKLASYEVIKQFRLLTIEFSMEFNEITPKLSLKRKIIAEKYRDVIDSMYHQVSSEPVKVES